MSSRSLLAWVALVAGAELAVRGHLAEHAWACHGGAALFVLALGAIAWPTRARRAGVAAAGVMLALAAVDAVWARVSPVETGPGSASPPPFPAPGPWLRAHFDCPPSVVVLDAAAPPNDARRALSGDPPALALVSAGPAILGALLEELPALRVDAGTLPGPRASPLGAALEGRWRRARAERSWRRALTEPPEIDPLRTRAAARYRSLVLAARRAGAGLLVLVPAAREGEPAPAERGARLAQEVHARIARAVAGAYGVRAIGLDAGPEALAARLAHPDAGCTPRPH